MKNEVLKELKESIDDILFKYDAPEKLREELHAELRRRIFSVAVAYSVSDEEIERATEVSELKKERAFMAIARNIEENFAAVHPTREDEVTTHTIVVNVLGHLMPPADAVVQGRLAEDQP